MMIFTYFPIPCLIAVAFISQFGQGQNFDQQTIVSTFNRSRRLFIDQCCSGFSCDASRPQAQRAVGVPQWTPWGSTLFVTMTPPVFFTRTFTPTVFIPTTAGIFIPITTVVFTTRRTTKKPKKKTTTKTTTEETTVEETTVTEETTTESLDPCAELTCPSHDCKKDDRKSIPPLYSNNGTQFLAAPSPNGALKIACGKLYLFSTNLKNYTDAGKICCAMSMRLLSFGANSTDQKCLSEMASFDQFFYQQTRLFWTSGSSMNCNYSWCPSNETITPGARWMSNFPKSAFAAAPEQDCVRLLFDRSTLALNTDYCSSLNYYICQGDVALIQNQDLVSVWPTTPAPATTITATTTTVAPCVTQKCPEGMCRRDLNNSVFVNNAGQFLTIPSPNGHFKVACGRLYLFSTNVKNLPDAISTCCAMSMTLATFGDLAKQNCVNELSNFDPDFSVARQFWTSGATVFCSLRWCTTNVDVANIVWMTSYPKPQPTPPAQDCLRLMLGKGVSLYNTDTCTNVNNYICEGDISLLQSINQVQNWPSTNVPFTTTPPSCAVICPTFQCNRNANYFTSNDAILTVPSSFGFVKSACGKAYMFSRASVSQVEASVACCELGMSLLSIDNQAEQDCLHSLNMESADMKYSTRAFWTSGSQRGCPLRAFKWCATNEVLTPSTLRWAPGQPNHANGVQDCVQLTINPGATTNTVLNDESCYTPFNFICEGPATLLGANATQTTPSPAPTCNATCLQMTCEKNPTFYSSNGKYLSVDTQVGLLREMCDSAVIFGNDLKTFIDAQKFCCQAGLRLLSAETLDKFNCLADANKGNTRWFGRKFWTSATTSNCPRVYRWCLEDQTAIVIVNDSFWRPGQPQDEGIYDCVQITLNVSSLNVLTDENCNSLAYPACEGTPLLLPWYTTTTPPSTQDPLNCAPLCPTQVCERNPLNYTRDGRFINESTAAGTFKESCGRLYLFSYIQMPYNDAYAACCDLGMRLLSVEDQFKHQCLVDLNNVDTMYTNKVFWTSGSDLGCPFKFKWCASNTWFSNTSVNWLPGQPNNAYGVQDCVQLTLTKGTWAQSTYNDDPCSFTYSFICEGDRSLYRGSSFYTTTSTTTTSTTTVRPTTPLNRPSDCDPVCPPFSCERDPFLFTTDGRFLNLSKVNGIMREACGKMYYFSVEQDSYTNAASTCCDMGMNLLSVETSIEHQCLTNLNQLDMRYVDKIFWTSGSQRNCPFNFRWCTATNNIAFTSTSIAWQPGQPNNLNDVQDCVQLTLNAVNLTNNGYNDEPCLYANYFICESDSSLLWRTTTTTTTSTTLAPTTTTPICNAICPQTTCDKDTKMFTADGKYLSDYITVSNTLGVLAETCGRLYFFGSKMMSATEARTICCSMGMWSVGVESLDENKCIAEIYGSLGLPTRIYWTSGSQKGCNLSFKWCSSNITFGPTSINWLAGQPNNLYGVQECVQMSLSQSSSVSATFNDDPCSFSYYFVCEGPASLIQRGSTISTSTTPAPCVASCPQVLCDRDYKMFSADGKYLDESALSSAGVVAESCGRLYFFGNRMVSANDANYYCCSLGMSSVAVETSEENQCLSRSYASTGLPSRFYWTSGSQLGCNLYFKWCSSNISFGSRSINWLQGQPNNLNGIQDCIQMTLSPGTNPLAAFNDDPCSYLYYYLCEGDLTLLERNSQLVQSTTPSPWNPNCTPRCPNVVCDKDPTLFTPDGKYLAVPSPIGTVRDACGKVYLFSNIQETQNDASAICCEAGMRLVSIETLAEHECLTQLNNVDMRYTSRMHWTSGNQNSCPFKFRWCPSNNTFSNTSINWLAGQPNNLNGIQDCVQFLLTTGVWTSSSFIDEACSYANYFICEADRSVLQSNAATTTAVPATTTTINPAFVTSCLPSCPSFTCDRDPSLFTADGQFLVAPTSMGIVKEICGKIYFFGSSQMSYGSAAAQCCDLGMSLLSVESQMEHQCITDLNNADMKYSSRAFWTSGSDRSCPFNFRWCTSPNNSFFYNSSINWQTGQPNNAFNAQDCVQLTLNTGMVTASTYDDQPCTFVNYFICEGSRLLLQSNNIVTSTLSTTTTTTTTAPPTTACLPRCPAFNCDRDPSYFTRDGQFLNGQPSIGILKETCGKLYFFGSSQLAYVSAATICCDLGMSLLSVETSSEHQCLTDLNNGDMRWSDRSFWTSGSDQSCPFNFQWCTAPSSSFFYNSSINWLAGQPNNAFNQQDCVQLRLTTGSWTASTYDDQPCNFVSFYICEGDRMLLQSNWQNATTTTTPPPTTTCQPKCPSFSCERDPSLFTSDGRYLNVPPEYGVIKETCGKIYFFSRVQDSFINGAAACCDLGMSLVSIESQYEHQCLTDLNNLDMKYSGRYFWTSGSQLNCSFNFRWCTSNAFFTNTSVNWMAGQPNNAFGIQSCVHFLLTTGAWTASAYDDQPCSYFYYFICEGDRLLLQSNNPTATTTPTTTTTPAPTTTCTPACPGYFCERDPSFFTPDGKSLSIPAEYGFVRQACGRLYFIGITQEIYNDTLSYCCDYGMTLLSVETQAEHQCLSDLNNGDANMRYSNRIFWTSGNHRGCPFNFRWCSSSGFFGNTSINWASGQPNNARGLQECVQLTLNAGVSTNSFYNDEACSFAAFYICEGDQSLLWNAGTVTTTTTTPPTTTRACTSPACPGFVCEKDPSLFTSDGRFLNVPISVGFMRVICGRLYLFSTTQTTYTNALAACCDASMDLISVESIVEHSCITDTNNNELRFNNRAFWTSGVDIGCPFRFQWCTGPKQAFSNTSINWAAGQPDNQFGIDDCVQWNLNTGQWSASTFADAPCNSYYYYICEGDPALLQSSATTTTTTTTTTTSTTTLPTTTTPCQSPLCSNPSCSIDSNYVNPDGSFKPIPSSIGYVKYACGRRYFFSTISRSKNDAALICCVLGTKLVSIETNAELTCLSDLNKGELQLRACLKLIF
ncbi:Hypothetical predicted protein [Cloeon dipterum]|uniref:C-type lectin domain-containing protein n=1 Tax=Cloeon dipterum TaxID=197152 RepID=A0A8S1DGP1_9INSE|nr:Hypothetical predicted protein [Cloeon dipterum]